MVEVVRVSSRGQIVIPEMVRKHLNIKKGTKMILIEKQGSVTLEPEEEFMKKFENLDTTKERLGWLALAEKGLSKIWDNPKDEKVWAQYL